jgi:hypothetical protein
MKKKNLLSLILISTMAFASIISCNKETTSSTLADEQNALEENKISTTVLVSGVDIEEATKSTGTPPAPNSNLNFDLNTNASEGFQNIGLNIEFSSTATISGAYIVFKDIDGNPTGSFYDVSSSSFKAKPTKSKKRVLKNTFLSAKNTQDYDNSIQVGFDSNVPAGQFCYDICLYDNQNNISQIQTVCVTVEAWGGNSDILGDWVLNKIEPDDFDDETTINCDNGQTITVSYTEEEEERELIFNFNENGTFSAINDIKEKYLDYNASQNNCSGIYNDVERYYTKETGNWAYNEEEGTLTMISFKFEDLLDSSFNVDFENGEVFTDGFKVDFTNGQLLLSDDFDGDVFKAYFDRK